MSEKLKDVEKMIAKVMKRKDCSRTAAIDYMLLIATGRLAALWRYDQSVPEGKANKGILTVIGRKKRAPKTPKIGLPAAAAEPAEASKPKRKPKSKPKAKAKPKAEETPLEVAAE
jgi:hypothetical protein